MSSTSTTWTPDSNTNAISSSELPTWTVDSNTNATSSSTATWIKDGNTD